MPRRRRAKRQRSVAPKKKMPQIYKVNEAGGSYWSNFGKPEIICKKFKETYIFSMQLEGAIRYWYGAIDNPADWSSVGRATEIGIVLDDISTEDLEEMHGPLSTEPLKFTGWSDLGISCADAGNPGTVLDDDDTMEIVASAPPAAPAAATPVTSPCLVTTSKFSFSAGELLDDPTLVNGSHEQFSEEELDDLLDHDWDMEGDEKEPTFTQPLDPCLITAPVAENAATAAPASTGVDSWANVIMADVDTEMDSTNHPELDAFLESLKTDPDVQRELDEMLRQGGLIQV